MPAGECHAFAIDLEAGEALRFTVEQRGVDVETGVSGPGGSELVTVDSLMGAFGREAGVAIADRPGSHRLELCRAQRALGAESYTLTAERRPATPADRAEAGAARAYRRARELHRRGRREEAVPLYQEAVELWREAGSEHGEAWALQALGDAWGGLGEWEPAREALSRSLALYRRSDERYAAARTCLELVTVQRKRGDLAAAEACATLALEVGQEYRDDAVIEQAETALGYVFYETGRAAEAVEMFRRLLAGRRADRAQAKEIGLLSALGTAYLGAGEPGAALENFVKARELLGASAPAADKAASAQNLGRAYRALGAGDDAAREFEEALSWVRRADDQGNVAETLNLLGLVAQDRGEDDRAGDLFREALATFERTENPFRVATARINLGQHLNRTGRPDEAREQCREALAISRRIARPAQEAPARYCIARALYQLGRLREALAEAERCVEVAEGLRREKSHAGHRATFADKKRHYYELPVTLHLALAAAEPDGGHVALAFAAAEAARARTLLELLRAAGADPRHGLDPETRRELDRLDERIAELHAESLLSASDPARRAILDRELSDLVEELRQREGPIRRADPAYAELTEPEAITLAEVQDELAGDGTQILAYFVGEDASWLWLIDRTSSAVVRLPPAAELEALAQEAHRLLAASGSRKFRHAAQTAAAALADRILGPVAGRLRGPRLAIVADGPLHSVPFAALPLPGAAGGAGGRPERLVERFEIVYPPSIGVVRALRRQRERRAGPAVSAVVLGDPVFSAHDLRADGDGSAPAPPADGVCAGLARLPNSEAEAQAIADLIPGAELRLGFAADRAWVLAGGLARAGIVHFATHACIDPRRPELSGIALSAVTREGRPADGLGLLLGNEIFGLELAADLVVVSACSSGLGPAVRGEGLLGITRGLMVAGAPQVLVSLWDVDDLATSELMQRFYREIERGRAPAAALAAAQREIARDPRWSDPAYWAGFVLQGDWRDGR